MASDLRSSGGCWWTLVVAGRCLTAHRRPGRGLRLVVRARSALVACRLSCRLSGCRSGRVGAAGRGGLVAGDRTGDKPHGVLCRLAGFGAWCGRWGRWVTFGSGGVGVCGTPTGVRGRCRARARGGSGVVSGAASVGLPHPPHAGRGPPQPCGGPTRLWWSVVGWLWGPTTDDPGTGCGHSGEGDPGRDVGTAFGGRPSRRPRQELPGACPRLWPGSWGVRPALFRRPTRRPRTDPHGLVWVTHTACVRHTGVCGSLSCACGVCDSHTAAVGKAPGTPLWKACGPVRGADPHRPTRGHTGARRRDHPAPGRGGLFRRTRAAAF
ncbi:hypothetical protein YUWDRAFT_05486 [Streptomyces sp. AmelKG-D3]|nr:hypothetical protein YUWDRAFT_05486 [Streptomyces sp. AmelKG-D3]